MMERAFRGVWIPAEIYLDERLTPTEVFLLAEIDSLDVGRGCREGDAFLAKRCKCDERTIRRLRAHLESIGLIETEKDGSERVIHRIPSTVRAVSNGAPRFVPPTLEEVKAYCAERQNNIDAERFVDYYQASGWMISRGQKVVDWKALLRSWENRPIKKLKEISQSEVVGYMAEAVENVTSRVEDVISIMNESQRQNAMIGYAINDLSEKVDGVIEAAEM